MQSHRYRYLTTTNGLNVPEVEGAATAFTCQFSYLSLEAKGDHKFAHLILIRL